MENSGHSKRGSSLSSSLTYDESRRYKNGSHNDRIERTGNGLDDFGPNSNHSSSFGRSHRGNQKKCHYCNRLGHTEKICWRNPNRPQCQNCQKFGHIDDDCWSKAGRPYGVIREDPSGRRHSLSIYPRKNKGMKNDGADIPDTDSLTTACSSVSHVELPIIMDAKDASFQVDVNQEGIDEVGDDALLTLNTTDPVLNEANTTIVQPQELTSEKINECVEEVSVNNEVLVSNDCQNNTLSMHLQESMEDDNSKKLEQDAIDHVTSPDALLEDPSDTHSNSNATIDETSTLHTVYGDDVLNVTIGDIGLEEGEIIANESFEEQTGDPDEKLNKSFEEKLNNEEPSSANDNVNFWEMADVRTLELNDGAKQGEQLVTDVLNTSKGPKVEDRVDAQNKKGGEHFAKLRKHFKVTPIKENSSQTKKPIIAKKLPFVTADNRNQLINTLGFSSPPHKFAKSSRAAEFSSSMRQKFSASAYPQVLPAAMPYAPMFAQSLSHNPFAASMHNSFALPQPMLMPFQAPNLTGAGWPFVGGFS